MNRRGKRYWGRGNRDRFVNYRGNQDQVNDDWVNQDTFNDNWKKQEKFSDEQYVSVDFPKRESSGPSRGSRGREVGLEFAKRGKERRERRGGPPRGLKGKEIGLWFARRGKEKREKLDISKRSVVTLDEKNESRITHLLSHSPSGSCSSGSGQVHENMSALNLKSPIYDRGEHSHSPSANERDVTLDNQMFDEFNNKQNDEHYKKMKKFRENLPSYKMKEDILQLIENNQVVVISGETGCGKTTQVAQFILDRYISQRVGSHCHVICTQPRRISAISVAERVADERSECLGDSVGFQIRLENKLPRSKGSILYCTTGILLRQMISNPLMDGVSHIILDEIHERDILSDFLMVIIKDLLKKRKCMKVVLMSATLNAQMFSQYFYNCPMIHIPGFTFPVKEIYLPEILKMTGFNVDRQTYKPRKQLHGKAKRMKLEEEEKFSEYVQSLNCPRYIKDTLCDMDFKEFQYDLIVSLITHICTNLKSGAILIFLPGWDQITKMHDVLLKNPVYRSDRFLLIPLHSLMPTTNQREVFEKPPAGKTKIIIATTIAETSITIDDVVYVIDCGKSKEKSYDLENNISCLNVAWVTKASATQRRGRAGRVQEGICFRLYTRYHFNKFADYQLPEMLRTPLESLCLQIKILGLGNVENFLCKSMQPPDRRAIKNALQALMRMRALDSDEKLTALGYHLAKLPVEPNVGRMIVFGAMFSCLDPVLTIAASLDFKEPFYVPIHKEKEADERKHELSRNSKSDHIMLVNAFKGWEKARNHGNDDEYCWRNFLSKRTLNMIDNMKRQFTQHLCDIGFTDTSHAKQSSANKNSENIPLIKAVVCAGLYPNVGKVIYTSNSGKQRPKIEALSFGRAQIHPKSVNSNVTQFDTQWLVYHEKMKTTKLFLYDCSMVSPFALLFFGGEISVHSDGGHETLEIDRNIKFHSPRRYAQLVKDLRKELDKLLQRKIENPEMNLGVGEVTTSRDSEILNAIIDLITKERVQNKGEVDNTIEVKVENTVEGELENTMEGELERTIKYTPVTKMVLGACKYK